MAADLPVEGLIEFDDDIMGAHLRGACVTAIHASQVSTAVGSCRTFVVLEHRTVGTSSPRRVQGLGGPGVRDPAHGRLGGPGSA